MEEREKEREREREKVIENGRERIVTYLAYFTD